MSDQTQHDTPKKNTAITTLCTVRDWLRYAVTEMHTNDVAFGQGTDQAWDDAVFLVLRSLNLPINQLDPYLDATLLPHEREHLFKAIEQRCILHIPTPYILGEAWLQGLRFKVTTDTLIPRSPIAELLVSEWPAWSGLDQETHAIADICTGSGCLAIIAALQNPAAIVHATDISPEALAVAHDNILTYHLSDRVKTYQGHLLDALPGASTYDLIICNPPYVNTDSMHRLPAEFRAEPHAALAGGIDGMDLVRELITSASNRLNANGSLLLEIGHERHHFEAAFPDLEPLWLDTAATEHNVLLLRAADLAR